MALRLIREFQGVLYVPPKENVGPGCLYPRVIELHETPGAEGTLLATFEQYWPHKPVFPIYRSTDHGFSWEHYSEVPDMKNGWGNKFQPHLFEFPCQLGEFPKGTVMLAGNSIPDDGSSTEIVIYISRDAGRTWDYLSSVVSGGRAHVDGKELALRPVWEPFLMADKYGDLVCYYSDERYVQQGYNQLLCYQVSKDGGRSWGEPVFNVAIPDGEMRPGMPVITQLPNGQYLMSYEMVGLPRWDVYCKLSPDGLDWGGAETWGKRVETADGQFLGSTPYCLWTPYGGENGTVIVSARREGEGDCVRDPGYFHVNYHLGEGPWERIPMPVSHDSRLGFTGYSQGMCLANDGKYLVHLCPVQMNAKKAQIVYTVLRMETV